MQVSVRLATMLDLDQVAQVFKEENRFHAELLPELFQVTDPIITVEWFEGILVDREKALYVAEAEGGRVIGVLLIEVQTSPNDPIFRPRRYAVVDEVAVLEEYRGQGVGRALMNQAHQWARDQEVSEVELQVWEKNPGAITFYRQLGYKTTRKTMRRSIERSQSHL